MNLEHLKLVAIGIAGGIVLTVGTDIINAVMTREKTHHYLDLVAKDFVRTRKEELANG